MCGLARLYAAGVLPFTLHRDDARPVSFATLAEAERVATEVGPGVAWQIYEDQPGERGWGKPVRRGIGPELVRSTADDGPCG